MAEKRAAFILRRFRSLGFFKMPVVAHFFQSPFAVDLLLQPPQGFVNGLAFF